jgi:hypothetical protein
MAAHQHEEIDMEHAVDTRLADAAPDLLAALQFMLERYGYSNPKMWNDEERAARAAIAKATGEQE